MWCELKIDFILLPLIIGHIATYFVEKYLAYQAIPDAKFIIS